MDIPFWFPSLITIPVCCHVLLQQRSFLRAVSWSVNIQMCCLTVGMNSLHPVKSFIATFLNALCHGILTVQWKKFDSISLCTLHCPLEAQTCAVGRWSQCQCLKSHQISHGTTFVYIYYIYACGQSNCYMRLIFIDQTGVIKYYRIMHCAKHGVIPQRNSSALKSQWRFA